MTTKSVSLMDNSDSSISVVIAEAGLPQDAGTIKQDDFTIEKLLEEKKIVSALLFYYDNPEFLLKL